MSDLGSRDPLLPLHHQGINPLMLPDLRIPTPDPKKGAATYVAGLGTRPVPVLTRARPQAPLQLGCSALITPQEAEAFLWQRGAALHSRHREAAGAMFRKLEDVEDVGQATEEWPTCMP